MGRRLTGPFELSIVIPAYNEADRLEGTLRTLQEVAPPEPGRWEIRVVDDGSIDGTAEIVRRAAARDARIVLQQEPHRGKGGALRAGLLAAHGALRFMCDADLSMPIDELPRFMTAVPATCDIAIGTREGPGARRLGEPGYRHAMGRAFNALVRLLTRFPENDTQCGFKMFSAPAVEAIFPWTTIEGWAIDVEVLTIARLRGLRVREIPIEWHYRERSQVSPIRDTVRMTRDVVRIRLNALRGQYAAQ